MAIAYITPNFDGQLNKLISVHKAAGEATRLISQRQWMLPTLGDAAGGAEPLWNGNLFDISGIKNAFRRNDLNAQYDRAITTSGERDGGRLADRYVSKVQIDYLAAMERAFRARHGSYVRCSMHAAARKQGLGTEDVSSFTNVKDYLNQVIDEGYVVPAQPGDTVV